MRSIGLPVAQMESGCFRAVVIGAAIAALSAALTANPVRAQENAQAAGGTPTQAVPQSGGAPGDGAAKAPSAAAQDRTASTDGDIEPVASRRGFASLQRRAHIKSPIAKSPIAPAAVKPAGSTTTAHMRILSPPQPAIEAAAPRNAIGTANPGLRAPSHDRAGVIMPEAGTRMTALGAAAPKSAGTSRPIPVPTNAGLALRGPAINGTAMRPVASGPGSVGGPAKDHSAINGTLMKPKY